VDIDGMSKLTALSASTAGVSERPVRREFFERMRSWVRHRANREVGINLPDNRTPMLQMSAAEIAPSKPHG
jgi:hypothetical protein